MGGAEGTAINANGGIPVDRRSRTSRYTQETGIDVKYGEKTWRPVQSVIDLVQNHLDANTTVYEKGLLSIAGVSDYNPANREQQEAISLLNKIKYSDKPEVDNTYSMLMGVLGSNTPPRESLHQQLQELTYPLPHVRLKVTKGTESQFVEYDHMKDLPPEWEVSGFRIDDTGSGFDYRLLGIMGASTKKESAGKRGGLGEGLKMSVTHLARSGATVRLVSRNDDQLWIAKPTIEDGTVKFEGLKREEAEPKVTGSMTDVNFSSPTFDPLLKVEIANALDPRRGEGLGKYILEFRNPQFASLINATAEVSSHDVPGGRVYVKGLLVEEPENLLWSYNLKEKWAISGRDRKTVQRDVLAKSIKGVVETTSNHEQVKSLLEALRSKKNYLEIKAVDGNLELGDTQKELWRQTVEEVFHFTPGRNIFASDEISTDQRRLAEQRGFNIISISSEEAKVIDLFDKLYPDQIVSFAKFQKLHGRTASSAVTSSKPQEETERTPEIVDQPVSTEVAEVLTRYKSEFTLMITGTVIQQFERGYGVPAQLKRLQNVKFAKAPSDAHFEQDSPFEYNSTRNTLYVREDAVKTDFATLTDMYIQLLKSATGKDVFDDQSQALLHQMVGETIARLRPELLTEFRLSDANGTLTFEKPITYSKEKHDKDDELITFYRHLKKVNSPNIIKDELEQVLAVMRAAKPQDLSGGGSKDSALGRTDIPHDQINTLFYFDGRLFEINNYSLQLHEISVSGAEGTRSVYTAAEKGKLFNPELAEMVRELFGKTKKPNESPPPKTEASDNPFSSMIKILRADREPSSRGPTRRLLNPEESDTQLTTNEWVYLPYQLQDKETMRLSIMQGNKEAQIVVKRKGDKIIATKVVDGKAELMHRGSAGFLGERYASTNVTFYNNVLLIRPTENGSLVIDHNDVTAGTPLKETNKGKEFISSNITLDYGGEVWRDPKRILLDAIQNHIDARRDLVPQVAYTVAGLDGKLLVVSKDQLQNMENNWNIIGVSVSDEGEGYPTPYLTNLGSSTKDDEDLGKFGEGLKMLAASAVRQGISVEIASRDWVAEPTGYQQTVKDYESGRDQTFNILGYNIQWQTQPQTGSRTSFSILSLEPGQTQLTQEQMTQLQATLSQGSQTGKIWQSWTEVLDPRSANQYGQRGLDRYVLPEEEQTHTNGVVNLLVDNPGRVYEKGLLIPGDIAQPMMFGYNLDETIIDTRERNAYNAKILDGYVSDYFRNLTDTQVMRKVLEMAKQNPGINYYEYKFMTLGEHNVSDITNALWRQTYHEVFGDDAVLSLRPLWQRIERHAYARSEYSRLLSYGGRHDAADSYRRGIASAVANEVHLENRNLQVLPEALTDFFSSKVFTSQDFKRELESAEIEISPEDKAKLVQFVKSANQMVLTVLESLDFSPDRREYLSRIVNPEFLQTRKSNLQGMDADNIRVKNPSFPAYGMVEDQEGQAIVYLNQKLLSDPRQLLDIYIHEVGHYLSGQKDYVLGFQRFLMALAANRSNRTTSL